MKQFRVVIGNKATEWLNVNEWTLADMEQWREFENYQIEWR